MPRKHREPPTPGAAFKEEYKILDNALGSAEGVRVNLGDHNAAIAYRHKLNRARLHHRLLDESGLSKYDTLMLSVKKGSGVIEILRYRGLRLTVEDIATGQKSEIGGEIEMPRFDPVALVAEREGISREEAKAKLEAELGEKPYDGEPPPAPEFD